MKFNPVLTILMMAIFVVMLYLLVSGRMFDFLSPALQGTRSGHWVSIESTPTGVPCWGWVPGTARSDADVVTTTCACASSWLAPTIPAPDPAM